MLFAGNLSVAEDSFQIHAKGSRPDEALDVTLKLPLLDPERPAEVGQASRLRTAESGSGPFGIKLSDLLPIPGFETMPKGATVESPPIGGGHFSLRCGQLLMSADVRPAKLTFCALSDLLPAVKDPQSRMQLNARLSFV